MNETNNSNLIQSNPAFRIPHYYGQFALFLGKESPYIFSKFNTDTFCGPSVSVLMRFDCLTKVKNPNWSSLDGGQTSSFISVAYGTNSEPGDRESSVLTTQSRCILKNACM